MHKEIQNFEKINAALIYPFTHEMKLLRCYMKKFHKSDTNATLSESWVSVIANRAIGKKLWLADYLASGTESWMIKLGFSASNYQSRRKQLESNLAFVFSNHSD